MKDKQLYGSEVIDTPAFDDLMFAHRGAMTAEGLHTKSDIVVELAARDYRIAELESQLALAAKVYDDINE